MLIFFCRTGKQSIIPVVFRNAAISKIGCGFGTNYVKENSTINYAFRCAYNDDQFSDTFGLPCSKCNDELQKCNKIYPGLCGKSITIFGIKNFFKQLIQFFSHQENLHFPKIHSVDIH